MASVKELVSKRSGYLGVVTRNVNALRVYLSKPVEDVRIDAEAARDKVLESKRKLDGINEALLEDPDCSQQTADDTRDSAGRATHSVVSVLDDYDNWLKNGPVTCTVMSGAQGNSSDIQQATLSALLHLQKSMDKMTDSIVSRAVQRALDEQARAYEQEKQTLVNQIGSLTKRLDRVQLVADVAAGTAVSSETGDFGADLEKRDSYGYTSTTLHSRDSAGPIRNRLSGFGRGRMRSDVLPPVGQLSPEGDSSLLMQSLLEQSMLQHKSLVANLQAPKVTLKKFGGNPLEYAAFISAFDDLIHNVVTSDRSRLLQLLEHCEGDAAIAVAGCAHMSADTGYSEARNILQENYGAAHIVTQSWLDKIMGYPDLDSGKILAQFASDLVCCRNSLASLNALAELECTGSLRLIVAKLPSYLRAKWRRSLRKKREDSVPRIDQLVELIKDAAEDDRDPAFSEESIAKVRATYGVRSPNPRAGRSGVGDKRAYVNFAGDGYFVPTVGEDRDIEAEVYAAARSACAACRSGQHFTSRCRNFKELGPKDRLAFALDKKLCLLCLSDLHSTESCPLPWRCQEKTCGKKHHTALHGAFATGTVNAANLEVASDSAVEAASYCCVSTGTLPIVKVKVQWGENTLFANALLDTGSTVSMVHEGLVDALGAVKKNTGSMFSIKTVTSVEAFEGKIVGFKISHPADNFKYQLSNAMVVPRIPVGSDCIPLKEHVDRWDHLRELDILLPRVEDGVQILIGQNNSHLLENGIKVKGKGVWTPYAVETPLGWGLYGCIEEEANWDTGIEVPLCYAMGGTAMVSRLGKVPELEEEPEPATAETREKGPTEDTTCDHGCPEQMMAELEAQLRRMAELDEVPDRVLMPAEDKLVLDLWEREMSYDEGHIVLPIPFKTEPPELINNFTAAYRSLKQLGRYLLPRPDEQRQYKEAIFAYFDKRIAEVVKDPNPAQNPKAWYLLHMGVKHPRKPGVTRVVKRGDAEYKGCSLNKAAYKGPDLMNSLIGVLTRFRQYQVGTTGDLEGMFNQVWIPENQRDYERFLFWEDGDPRKKIIICRMKSHVFGSVWAPAAANFAVKKLAEAQEQKNPGVAESMRKEFYVDDWMNSERDHQRSSELLAGVRAAVAEGSFNMCKVASNSREVLQRVAPGDRAKELAKVNVTADKLPRSVMLGQHWEPDPDSLVFTLLLEPKPFTRRGMTSCVASIFDPLGLLAPFLLPAKILMQEGCRGGAGWDEELLDVTAERWSEWLKELEQVESFRLRRWFGCSDFTRQLFHTFADASEKAYGAAAFLAVFGTGHCGDTGATTSTLVSAKSRVAPTKRLTIPQLEMAGAVLAVKLATMAIEIFSIPLQAVYYWVDSTIVLVLIHKDPGELKTYMGNRVAFIQEFTEVTQWGHVPSELNPADLASRGMRMSELVNSDLWLNGPDFIRQEQSAWPARTVKIKPSDNAKAQLKRKPASVFVAEVRTACVVGGGGELVYDASEAEKNLVDEITAQVMAVTAAPDSDSSGKLTAEIVLTRYSAWEKTVRLAAYISMLTRYWRAKREKNTEVVSGIVNSKGQLRAEDLDLEEINLIAWAQRVWITEEDKQSAAWKKLTPLLDGAWRVGGRFLYAELPHDAKHPLILPRTGPVTDQIIRRAHLSAGHGGADRTMMELRRSFWVLGGRVTVKKVTDVCILCRRIKGSPCEQQMAPLPAERLVTGRPVFWYTGVDLFGPVHVVLKRSQVKRYGALFTCMNTRAVHLEPVEDLTTSAFLDTLERFVDRRGKPDTLRSDNGTNFVGAEKEMAKANALWVSRDLQNQLANRRIKWRFNAPSASHQGGVWERLIRSVRQLLMVLTDGSGLSDSRFHTVLCMAESMMNSRPLTRMTEDPDSLEAITPFHFINLQGVRSLFPVNRDAEQLRKDWRLSQELASEFWDRWVGLYLPSLQSRTKWLEQRRNVRERELVLVVNDQVARCDWPLGVITKVHPGKDGLVRNVTVRTQNGFLNRPVQKIVRLEMDVT